MTDNKLRNWVERHPLTDDAEDSDAPRLANTVSASESATQTAGPWDRTPWAIFLHCFRHGAGGAIPSVPGQALLGSYCERGKGDRYVETSKESRNRASVLLWQGLPRCVPWPIRVANLRVESWARR